MSINASTQLRLFSQRLNTQMRLLPFKAKVVLGVALFFSIAMYGSIIHYFFLYNHLSDFKYLEENKCPACYGHTLCRELKAGMGKYEGYSRLQFLNRLANQKNVNFGVFGGLPVVYKKLAHDYEMEEFEQKLCEKANMGVGCRTDDAIQKVVKGSRNLNPEEVKGLSDLTACPSLRLADRIVDKYREKADAIDLSYPEKLMLMTTLMVNPEPIVIQTFPKSDGFPFPNYLGACGRYVAEENVGKTLGDYYDAPWEERVDYATQIFRIAELFTDHRLAFALYWSDMSYDNFAVSKEGKVLVIDAENIVVVDRWKIKHDKKEGWDQPHYVEFQECERYGTCLTVDTDLLCTRYDSDHNYYSACRNLLSSYGTDRGKPGGLLHGTPQHINERYHLDDMLRDCAKPDTPDGRVAIKEKLLQTLEEIRRNVM